MSWCNKTYYSLRFLTFMKINFPTKPWFVGPLKIFILLLSSHINSLCPFYFMDQICWSSPNFLNFHSVLIPISFHLPANVFSSVSSVTQSCLTLCDPMDCSTPGLPVHHQLPESTQTHVHWVGDAIQPTHPLSSPSPPALNLSQHQGLFKWISSFPQVAKCWSFSFKHQYLQSIFGTDFL